MFNDSNLKFIFQSFTAKHLGGVIHLVDKCDEKDTQNKGRYPLKSDLVPTFRPQLGAHLMATKIANTTQPNDTRRNASPTLKPRNEIRRKRPRRKHNEVETPILESSILGDSSSFLNNKRHRNNHPKETIHLQERLGNGGSSSNDLRRMDSDIADIEYVDNNEPEIDFFDAQTRKQWNQCKARASQKERRIDTNPSNSGLPVFEHFPIRALNKELDEKSQRNFDMECKKLVQRFVAKKSSRKGIQKPSGNNGKLTTEYKSYSSNTKTKTIDRPVIINDALRKQIQLQDMYSNSPDE